METVMRFDKNSTGWTRNEGTNRYWLNITIGYLKEKFTCRGYMYLNEIHDALGIKWNPDDINLCYRAEDGLNIEYESAGENEFVIKIYQ